MTIREIIEWGRARFPVCILALAIAVIVLAANSGMPVLFSGRYTNAVTETHFAVVLLIGVIASQSRLPWRGLVYGLSVAILICLGGGIAQLSFDIFDSEVIKAFGIGRFRLLFHGDRAFFPWSWPGGMGCFAAMSAPILFCAEAKWLSAIGVGACLALLLLSGSKAAIVAIIVASWILVRQNNYRQTTKSFCLVLGALGVMVVALMPRHVGTGFISSRLDYWHAAILTIADHPFVGVGAGGFGDHFTHYLPGPQYHYSRLTHSDPLMLCVEHGLFAGALYVGILGATLWRGLRLARLGGSSVSGLQSALVASLSAFTVCSLVDYPLYAPSLAILAALICGQIWQRGAAPTQEKTT